MSDQPAEAASDGLHDFIFYRELAEIYLLLDNISASTTKTLHPTGDAVPKDAEPPPGDWVEAVCQIRWPPQQGQADRAQQAAMLLRARDWLNQLAEPATGATIAFTLLVAGEDKGEAEARPRQPTGLDGVQSRYSLATIAFPNLKKPAADFRTFKWLLIFGLLLWFVVTSVLSWNIATGNALLGQLATIEKTNAAAQNPAPANRPDQTKAAPPEAPPCAANSACALQAQNLMVAQLNVRRWLGTWQVLGVFTQDKTPDPCPPQAAPAACPPVNEQWASTLLIVLGGNVLPIFYGVLGAGAAVVRILSARIKASMLAPRHKTLFLVQLVLGAVIGGCIGLFVSPPGASASTTPGLLGSVPLSASALCFIAGFGVDGVFLALQGLINRVFAISDPVSPKADARTGHTAPLA